MKNIFFFHFSTKLTAAVAVQFIPLQQLLPDGNGPVGRENEYHADELRLLLR